MFRILKYSGIAALLLSVGAYGDPGALTKVQPVELIEVTKAGVYTERTVNVQYMADATAAVCVRGLDVPKMNSKAKCFYRMHGSDEVVVIELQIIGETTA